ncbi:thioredoxin family protein [Nocardia arthritidis]|uniref:thioredoxin family protein n=1 Tax=Nocardia arthritidis TaxID=228602 RepID=UPI0007A52DBB|nr:thioredoxin domain-containing protein [Nocardia arthritidis]
MPTITPAQDDFGSVVASHSIVLVDRWAGWCGPGPCRHFAPVYESSAQRHPRIVHGKVDPEAEAVSTATGRVTPYPTSRAFRDGVLVYSAAGVREPDALEDLVQQILWRDMDRGRWELAQRADAEQPAAAGGSGSARRAGLAPTTPRDGWPGL